MSSANISVGAEQGRGGLCAQSTRRASAVVWSKGTLKGSPSCAQGGEACVATAQAQIAGKLELESEPFENTSNSPTEHDIGQQNGSHEDGTVKHSICKNLLRARYVSHPVSTRIERGRGPGLSSFREWRKGRRSEDRVDGLRSGLECSQNWSPVRMASRTLICARGIHRCRSVKMKGFTLCLPPGRSGKPPSGYKSSFIITPARRPADNHSIKEYFDKKKSLQKKYSEMLRTLAVEEAPEAQCVVLKARGGKVWETLPTLLETVRNDYEYTRNLLLQQKLVEESELLESYRIQLIGHTH